MSEKMLIERHPSLYHADGDIVLSAKASPEQRQLFRVHKVFLAHYSDVFRDMFQVVSQENHDETYDGVPVVTMPDDDTAEDFATLLDIVYSPTYASSLSISGLSKSAPGHCISSCQRRSAPRRPCASLAWLTSRGNIW